VLLAAGTLGAAQSGPAVRSGQEPPARRGASGRRLLPQVDTLRLRYIAWGCACPPWATPADMQRYQDDNNELARHTVFIEPATPALALPEHYYANNNRYNVRVTGQFYARPAYPQGLVPEEGLPRARVFRYTKYELEEVNPFQPQDDIKLVLSYEAQNCVCPKWLYRPKPPEFGSQQQVYLEPANGQLPDADKLSHSARQPLRVQVTGQFVSESGLPKGIPFLTGDPQKAPVFRYRSLEVLTAAATKPQPRRRQKR
jgi:hypothetical protein